MAPGTQTTSAAATCRSWTCRDSRGSPSSWRSASATSASNGRSSRARGWRIRDSVEVTSTPWDYRAYIQGSRGEFSCVKPSCVKLQNAWISDRTICYLASGKPAVVQDTGPSRILPSRAGLLRFRTPEDAAECLEEAATDYERHAREARALAEDVFDASKVATHLLAVALG